MKYLFNSLALFLTISVGMTRAQASEEKILICQNEATKVALTTTSSDFYEADLQVADSDLRSEENFNSEGIVSYNSNRDQFIVDNRQGCVPLMYKTIKNTNGEIHLKVKNLDDSSISKMKCHWLKKS